MTVDIAGLIQSYGYLAVAVGTFLEGESVLVIAGAVAHRGHLSLPIVIAIASLASFLGDQLYFLLGRKFGWRLLVRFPSLRPRVERMHRLLDRHQSSLILAIRFLYGLRIAGPVAVGMSSVSWPRFLLLNLIAAIAWATLVACIGYGTGYGLTHLLRSMDADEFWGLALLLACLVYWWLATRVKKAVRG